jgi:hypothetical protein
MTVQVSPYEIARSLLNRLGSRLTGNSPEL